MQKNRYAVLAIAMLGWSGLAALGAGAPADRIDTLLSQMKSSDTSARQKAALAFMSVPVNETRRGEVAQALALGLKDEPAVRYAALGSLTRWWTPGVVPAICEQYEDKDAHAQVLAAQILTRTGDKRAIDSAIRVVATSPAMGRQVLTAFGRAAEEPVLNALPTATGRQWTDLVNILSTIGGGKSVEVLKSVAAGPASTQQATAQSVIQRIQQRLNILSPDAAPGGTTIDPKAVPTNSAEMGERVIAALENLKSGDWDKILPAARSLKAGLVPANDDQLRQVSAALVDVYGRVRYDSDRVDLLGAMAHWTTADAVPVYIQAMESGNLPVTVAAVECLAASKDERALAPLVKYAVQNPTRGFRALETFGPGAEESVIQLLKSDNAATAGAAALALSKIGGEKSLLALKERVASAGSDAVLKRRIEGALTNIQHRLAAQR